MYAMYVMHAMYVMYALSTPSWHISGYSVTY